MATFEYFFFKSDFALVLSYNSDLMDTITFENK